MSSVPVRPTSEKIPDGRKKMPEMNVSAGGVGVNPKKTLDYPVPLCFIFPPLYPDIEKWK